MTSNYIPSLLLDIVCKVESRETNEQALIRECREEPAIMLPVGDVFMDVIHEYIDFSVHLTLFNATIADGEPQKLEHNDIQWITPSEIANYEFCPADEEILAKICEVCKLKTMESKFKNAMVVPQLIKSTKKKQRITQKRSGLRQATA